MGVFSGVKKIVSGTVNAAKKAVSTTGNAAKKAGNFMVSDTGTALSNIGGTVFSALSGDRSVKRQIAWERERAQNAHQWEVADLKAAGLNPILSAGGSGAVTGGISAPVADTSGLQNSASEAARIAMEKKHTQNETENTKANVLQADTQAALNQANEALAREQTAATAEKARQAKADADLAEATFEALRPQLKTEKEYNESGWGKTLRMLNRGGTDLAPILTMGLIGGGAFKAIGAMKAAKTAKAAAKSEKFANSIMHDTGKIPLNVPNMIRTHPY